MSTLACEATINADNHLVIPVGVAAKLPKNQPVRLLIVVGEADQEEDRAWERLAAESFAAGYSESDAVYDNL